MGAMVSVPLGLCEGIGAGPTLQEAMGGMVQPFNIADSRCLCDSRFVAEASAGTWTGTYDSSGAFVNACPSGVKTATESTLTRTSATETSTISISETSTSTSITTMTSSTTLMLGLSADGKNAPLLMGNASLAVA